MSNPLVSVILPNYNHEKYLPQRIESILNQTFTNFELIILDDCSPDNSREIIADYAERDSRISTLFNTTNSGSTFKQWNKGVDAAKGKYLWIAESDDYCELNFLETLVPIMESNSSIGIAMAQSYIVDEKNEIINSYNENYKFIYKERAERWNSDFLINGKKECAEYLIFSNTIPNASGALMRKSVYLDCGGAEVGWKLNGDWYFYAKMLLISDLKFVAKHLNYFRFHEQTQRQKANLDHVVYDEIIHTVNFIENNVDVNKEYSERAWREIAGWWGGSLYRQKINRDYFKHNWRLYKFFRQKRPRLLLNVLSNSFFVALGNFLEWIGVKKTVKKWRSKLFPGKYFEY